MFIITKRSKMNPIYKIILRIFTIVLALIALGVLLKLIGKDPIGVYSEIVKGSLGSKFRIKETIKIAIPLTLTGVGVMLAFKLKFWNIGAEGQIKMGAIIGSYFALFMSNIPSIILIPIMFLTAMLAGGLYALIPAFFKVKYKTNETLFTLMMNYIAYGILSFLQYDIWRDPKSPGFAKIAQFADSARLPMVAGVHMGWIVMIVVLILVYVLVNHTKMGFEIEVVGASEKTAKYAGINVGSTVLKTLFFSGAICGLVGIIQAAGVNGTLSIDVSGGYGFSAIIIAWLSGMSTLFIPIVAFLFAMLTQGANFVQTSMQIPQSVAEILQAMILIFALGGEFFINYKIGFNKRGALK